MPVKIKLIERITEKARDEKRIINIPDVEREAKVSRQVLHNWKNGKISRIDISVLDDLMVYFGCTEIDELIEFIPPEKPKKGETT